MGDLKKEESLRFSLFFQRGNGKRYDLGKLDVDIAPLAPPAPDHAEIKIDLVIDSILTIINCKLTGSQVLDTKLMNLLKADYTTKDMRMTVRSRLAFDPADYKLKIDETYQRNGESEKPLTNIFIKGPAQVYDSLSLLFKLRTIDLRQGETVSLAVCQGRRLYPILVEFAYFETVDFRKNRVECRVYTLTNRRDIPTLKKKIKILNSKVWVTNDANAYPIGLEITTDDGRLIGELVRP